jgi:hypothetical protein
MRYMAIEIRHTPNGNPVTIEHESRVDGPGPHVVVYDKSGKKYRVAIPGENRPGGC